MGRKIAILQSNYIPWKGYFDLINSADEFVLYDDMQYTKNDWRNRNKVITRQGVQWLTIPVRVKSLTQKICDTKVSNHQWWKKHWKTISQSYSKAPYFKQYADLFESLYQSAGEMEMLSDINSIFIYGILRELGGNTIIKKSSDFDLLTGKSERLLGICEDVGASTYISGPAAQDYIDINLFQEAGISIEWMDYSSYPEYSQVFGGFYHGVSILDLLFNTGKKATAYMKSFGE